MTMQKHFKERVRSRMQKTGESYTTARRHVLNQKPTATSTDSTALVSCWYSLGNIPATTALRVSITHAGVLNPHTAEPFSEPLLFVLAGGIGVGMFTFFYEKENCATFFIAGRHSWFDDLTYCQEALTRFGVRSKVMESSGRKAADKQLRDALATGAPCIAWVDMAMLPHRGMPAAFQGGGYHVVTVYKIEGDQVFISDMTDEPIQVSLADFAAARERIKKQKNRVLTVEPFTGKLNLKELVRDGLRAGAKGLVEAKMGGMKTNFRLESLKIWAERLHGSTEKESWGRIFAAPENLWRALTSIYEFIESYGTGGGLCRTIFAEGLTEAGELLGDAKWHALAKRYAKLGDQWTALAEAALPSDVPLFAEARDLMTRRAELLHAGGPTEAVRDVWSQLGVLAQRAKAKFPLNPKDSSDLRAELQKRVRDLYEGEVAAQQALLAATN